MAKGAKDKKDKKTKAAEKKVRQAQKTEKKAAQKDKKAKSKGKGNNADSDDDADVDLDAILQSYAKQQEVFLAITETISEPPSARSSATILANPANEKELLLFGGEFFDGQLARFYNDLCIYHIGRDEWRCVTSPNSPLPRSGHAWTRAGNTKDVYLFGGEFSSPKQGTFHHYGDFWKLEPGSREWTRVEVKGKGREVAPTARSGHRMTYFKQYIILYGGFQDTARETKYLNDVWVYDCVNFTWHQPPLPPTSPKPEPRSSCTLLPHERGAVLYGGYSRVRAPTKTTPGSKSNRAAQLAAQQKAPLKPFIHTDTWFLRITPPAADAAPATAPVLRWEKRKRPANAPNPPRAGVTMAHHRGRGVLFGGVFDVEDSEEGISSEFFDGLFVWNVERNRFYPLALRRPRQTQAKKGGGEGAEKAGGRRARGKADEAELLSNLARLEMKTGNTESAAALLAADDSESDDDKRPEKPVQFQMPHPRFNAQLTVQNDVLFIFGGTYEKMDREFTFDELFAIDLGKLDGVREIFHRELADWVGDEEGEDESDEDENEDMGSSEEDDDDEEQTPSLTTESTAPSLPDTAPSVITEDDLEEEPIPATREEDSRPYPRPFESLREFFNRTSQPWQEMLIAEGLAENKTVKELRKAAFEKAEQRWWDVREEIVELEEERAEAGVGEVVNLAEKGGGSVGGGGGNVGRRR